MRCWERILGIAPMFNKTILAIEIPIAIVYLLIYRN